MHFHTTDTLQPGLQLQIEDVRLSVLFGLVQQHKRSLHSTPENLQKVGILYADYTMYGLNISTVS